MGPRYYFYLDFRKYIFSLSKIFLIFFTSFELVSLPFIFLILFSRSQFERTSSLYYLIIFSLIFRVIFTFRVIFNDFNFNLRFLFYTFNFNFYFVLLLFGLLVL